MTFNLWPDFQGHVKRNLGSVPFQHLKLANFGMFAGDMDMDRCWEVTSMVYTDFVTRGVLFPGCGYPRRAAVHL